MNKNLKMLATIIPLIAVPLFNERKKITKHPDMQKLGAVSGSVYTRVKDSTAGAASTAYETTRNTAQNISSKVSHTLEERSYNKEAKSYQKSLNKEETLEKRFEKDKAAHKAKRNADNEEKGRSFVPKIFQSHSEKSAEDIQDGMTVSDEVMDSNEVIPDINTDKLTEPDNREPDYGEMYMFEDIEEEPEDRLEDDKVQNELVPYKGNEIQINESSEKMTNIQEVNEEKVLKDTEFTRNSNEQPDGTLPLREQHKNILDPRSAARDKYIAEKKKEKEELRNSNSLFNQHRRMNLEHSNKLTRKVTDGSAYVKDQSIKNYEALMFNK
ncbi:hypothetical protein GCM10007275_11720 [Jeotgalicoccus coquinae]|uniref:Uncharacterized protein n=1 Tax=Jeotgalicoccus coquinae TaxID=709509 RepID=A0A6V7RN73_9STAP|nr:hypothetical protein [Jeotgalicoccus coquinae]MBB6422161.1 hypothetical protein [Jeotgalicoccus coquinae]GGE18167.1 hypothetical protein GCM10007275_11720 [Jeotgalicoccus coquinae]CAD2079473.1 hypothetical protein JEOCOQ751_01494 [Jeotgalicoccus coquinae]